MALPEPPDLKNADVPEAILSILFYLIRCLLYVFYLGIKSLTELLLRVIKYSKVWFMSLESMRFRKHLSKVGNSKKVFIFGAPHAGKSTVLACFLHYLSKSDFYSLRRDPVKNPEGVRLIRDMLYSLENNNFPDQTELGFFQNIVVEIEKPNSESTKIVFQEISGETVEKFDPTHKDHKNLDKNQSSFLLDSNGVLIIASSSPKTSNEKESLNDFLELLYRKKYNRPILFMLTKCDFVANSYSNEVMASQAIYKNSIDLLFKDSQSSLIPFSVGEVANGKIVENRSGEFMPNFIQWLERI